MFANYTLLVCVALVMSAFACADGGRSAAVPGAPIATAAEHERAGVGRFGKSMTAARSPSGARGSGEGAAPVPEPMTILLLGIGLVTVARRNDRRRRLRAALAAPATIPS